MSVTGIKINTYKIWPRGIYYYRWVDVHGEKLITCPGPTVIGTITLDYVFQFPPKLPTQAHTHKPLSAITSV